MSSTFYLAEICYDVCEECNTWDCERIGVFSTRDLAMAACQKFSEDYPLTWFPVGNESDNAMVANFGIGYTSEVRSCLISYIEIDRDEFEVDNDELN